LLTYSDFVARETKGRVMVTEPPGGMTRVGPGAPVRVSRAGQVAPAGQALSVYLIEKSCRVTFVLAVAPGPTPGSGSLEMVILALWSVKGSAVRVVEVAEQMSCSASTFDVV